MQAMGLILKIMLPGDPRILVSLSSFFFCMVIQGSKFQKRISKFPHHHRSLKAVDLTYTLQLDYRQSNNYSTNNEIRKYPEVGLTKLCTAIDSISRNTIEQNRLFELDML